MYQPPYEQFAYMFTVTFLFILICSADAVLLVYGQCCSTLTVEDIDCFSQLFTVVYH